MTLNTKTDEVTETLRHVHVVLLLDEPKSHIAQEIQTRTQGDKLGAIPLAGGRLFCFGNDSDRQKWLEKVDGLLREARIRYILVRLVDPVFGLCDQQTVAQIQGLGLHSFCTLMN